MGRPPSLTQLLQSFAATRDNETADALLRDAWPRLRQIAASALRNEQSGFPVRPTELIHEAWLTRLHQGNWHVQDREEFFAIAARAMRFVVVDLARKRRAQKRPDGREMVPIDLWAEKAIEKTATAEQILAIDRLVAKLEQADPGVASVFEMKYFLGFTLEEIAAVKGITFRQARHRWDKASDWLKKRLGF